VGQKKSFQNVIAALLCRVAGILGFRLQLVRQNGRCNADRKYASFKFSEVASGNSLQFYSGRRKTWRILTAVSALPERNTLLRLPKKRGAAQMQHKPKLKVNIDEKTN
jgi:hypothetical protein